MNVCLEKGLIWERIEKKSEIIYSLSKYKLGNKKCLKGGV
jgi:hypothetical protein